MEVFKLEIIDAFNLPRNLQSGKWAWLSLQLHDETDDMHTCDEGLHNYSIQWTKTDDN